MDEQPTATAPRVPPASATAAISRAGAEPYPLSGDPHFVTPHFTQGITTRVEMLVTDADTAQTMGSGDVPVLATPRVLALAEAACVAATARQLPSGMTTVGASIVLEHLAPTPVGRTVAAYARLNEVDGRRLSFDVSVTEGATVVARGRIERVLVDRQGFVASAFADR